LWRGGGRIFPSSPDENFSHKLNRKMYRAGMASILSQLVREDRLAVVDSLADRSAEDQAVRARRSRIMGYDSVLVITDSLLDENVFLAARNLPNVLVVEVKQADPVSLVHFPKVLMTKGALAKFEEILG
jgi:large subunit ribosomal protein L4